MVFDYSKVYTAVNADNLEVGSKVYVSKNLYDLCNQVESDDDSVLCELVRIRSKEHQDRFVTKYISDVPIMMSSTLAYLVSEPEKKKLKWTDLKIGDIIVKGERTAMVTSIDGDDDGNRMHIFAGCWLMDDNLEEYKKLEEDDA